MRQVKRRKGFTLLTTAICIIVLMGMLGLVIDLGRSYIAKNETQGFTDAAAMAAAAELDNTMVGINAAKSAVTTSANKWYFNSKSFTGVTTEFSTDNSSWSTAPAFGTNFRYVRVTAPTNSLTTYFMTALGAPTTMNVAARSVAGIKLPTSFPQGVFPFSPIAHSMTGPNFGYTKGDELTLLWPSSTESNGGNQKLQNLCQSDRTQQYLNMVKDGSGADRGYIMETSASAIAAAIEDDKMNYTVTVGGTVTLAGGVKTTDVYNSLNARSDQDSSPQTQNYDTYISSHDSSPMRRVVIVPIVESLNTTSTPTVLGFVKVFLPPDQPHNPNKSKCATYIGPADTPTGNSASGDNFLRLIE
ncbi:MAG: pilus assembly protein TadG-related protein [Acidobacteriota bacterium]